MHVVEYYSCFFTFYISISLPILSDPTKKDSKPSYDLFPENENEKNSNSYAVGLLRVSHIDDLGTPPYEVPGYEYPLAKKYFGVGDE